MMEFPLTLCQTKESAPPAAWLIPGADAGIWIDEISRWSVSMDGLRLYLLPRSLQDSNILGVLVTRVEAMNPNRVRRAQPYRCLADRLYLPANSRLDAAVSEFELRSLLVWEIQILHPSAGLIGCRRDESLKICDLLAPPVRREIDWDRVSRATKYAPRLLAVEAESPPTLEIILEQGRDGIGSQSPQTLPPDEDEPKLDRLLDHVSRPGLKFIQWMASHAPGGAGWMKSLREWASRQLQAVDQSILESRFRELQRLRKMFESNPDEALKFAIPFRETDTVRGRAAPGGKLGERNPTFDMNRLSGGQPADSWSMPASMRDDLVTRYRAAANRELNLRRYTRAAYVFAELLADFSSAANALEQGRYYREAATLYRDRLKNPAAAAKCLKQGGLLLEAVVIYEELGEFEEAGDLYTAVDRNADAERCYREAVKKEIARGGQIDAARLLETKLHSPDEALDLLISDWPAARSSPGRLQAHFDLLERLNRHDETLRRVTLLRDQQLPGERVQSLVDIFVNLAIKHPAPPVRLIAGDATRVVAGRRLAAVSGAEAKALVSAVTRLCPDDRLLVRDGARYLTAGPKPYKLARPVDKPKLIAEFRLPGNTIWKSAVSAGDIFFAIGADRYLGTLIVRCGWHGKSQYIKWPGKLDAELCALEPAPYARTLFLIPFGVPVQSGVFDAFMPSEGFPDRCRVGVPAWLPAETILGAGQDEGGTLWVSHTANGPEAVISAFSCETGQLLATHGPFEIESTMDGLFAKGQTPVLARHGRVFLVTGQTIRMVSAGPPAKQARWQFPHPVVQAIASPPHTLLRLALAFDEGGVVLWEEGAQQPFAQGMQHPKIGFTRGGSLVAVSGNEVRVYQTAGLEVSRPMTYPIDCKNVIAVCAGPRLHEIRLIGSDGQVRVFEFPSQAVRAQ